MFVEIINPIDDIRWLKFITEHPDSNIFHHPFWLDLLNTQYKFDVKAVTSVNSSGKITSGLPFCEIKNLASRKKWIALPFSDYCNPLFNNENEFHEIEEFLINKRSEECVDSIEIRQSLPNPRFFVEKSGMVVHYKELKDDIDEIFSSFKKTRVQQRIKKAEREGLDCNISNSKKSINEFYLLHLMTRKKLGVPIQPKKFFYNFYEKIIQKGLGFIVVIYLNKKPISAGVFAGYGNFITYKYSASDPGMMKLHPNHLMLWTAIKESIKRGFKFFDFGKTDIENKGLREFKSGWGSVERPLYYSYYPNVPSGTKLKFINEKFISPIIKSSPQIVCRIVGEVAYKYFPSL